MASSAESIFLEGEELMALVRERTAAGQGLRYIPFRGISMLPMLRQGRDSVELSPLPERLKKYDLPVYQYPSGKYVMHRVVKVEEDHYICNGDNLLQLEKVRHDQMIALVTAFTRDSKRIEVTDFRYQLYCRLWVGSRSLRHTYRRIRAMLGRIKRKLF